jgi:acetyl-CoA acyltransferase
MSTAVVVDALRSPMGKGKPGGSLSGLHAVELLSQVLQALVARTGIDPGIVDDVIVGCVSQGGEQAATPGRMAWLGAGYPAHVPSTTIDRRCGSSQQAISFAAQGIEAGAYDVVIAAGIESMSRVPMGSARMGQDPYGPSVRRRYAPGLVAQGISAELVAAKWSLDREALDAYAARSHRRAAAAAESGEFAAEIAPIQVPDQAGHVDADETIRPNTTPEGLSRLKPAFYDAEMAHRFPEMGWHITAGNSSQLTDGASAVLIMSEARAAQLGLPGRARVHASYVCGDDPVMMLTGPIPATKAVLERGRVRLQDLDHVEINEAFASVPLAWLSEFPIEEDRLNPVGGAIALGHPLGASGARLFTTMLYALERSGGRWGLQAMCEAGGMANATLVERL